MPDHNSLGNVKLNIGKQTARFGSSNVRTKKAIPGGIKHFNLFAFPNNV